MKYIILGIIAISFSPFTALGMALNDLDYWFAWDVFAIIALPVIGYALIKKAREVAKR